MDLRGWFRKVTRVSLSDCLPYRAGIRGFENPRLLRDRPSDGAALDGENLCGITGRHSVRGRLVVRGWFRRVVRVSLSDCLP